MRIVLIAWLLAAPCALAGTDADVTIGMVMVQNGDFDAVIVELEQGLESPEMLKAKSASKPGSTVERPD